MAPEFNPMRSLIFVDVVKEEYRHHLLHWLMRYHVPDSISQFGPYVSKYAYYAALPVPPDGDRFGAARMQLTEHYWMVNPFGPDSAIKALTEYFPVDVLKWQGNVPEDISPNIMFDGDDARAQGGKNSGTTPFLFAFVPLWWEEDLKGKKRTVEDGPNYRWLFAIHYPDGVTPAAGDKWLYSEVFPKFKAMPEVNRILTSKVIQSVNNCAYSRVVEMWFGGPIEWHRAVVEKAQDIRKPDWAAQAVFPYLASRFDIQSLFLSDIAFSDHLTQYRGWITMR